MKIDSIKLNNRIFTSLEMVQLTKSYKGARSPNNSWILGSLSSSSSTQVIFDSKFGIDAILYA